MSDESSSAVSLSSEEETDMSAGEVGTDEEEVDVGTQSVVAVALVQPYQNEPLRRNRPPPPPPTQEEQEREERVGNNDWYVCM